MKNRHKLSNIRSGGIIVAIKDNIAKHINVIDTDCKFIMWLKLSKVLFNIDKDVICGVVYIPPEASKYSSNDSFMKIEQELFNFSKDSNYFCFMGDLNSRVGRLGDFVEPDVFITNVKQHNVVTENIDCASYFETLGIPISRAAIDTVCNNFGYKMIDFCKNNNFFIANGRVGNDIGVGALTCKNSSTVDYDLCSRELFQYLCNVKVLDFCKFFYDVHKPISFSIKTNVTASIVNSLPAKNQPTVKLWSANNTDVFREKLDHSTVERITDELLHLKTSNTVNEENIKTVMTKLCKLFITTAEQSFGEKT